jgi:GT2 family glycosyltransferase
MINKITIIIVTWNTAKITEKCIKTINKYLPDQEIIIIDNNSQDNTIELLSKFENLKIIKNNSNLGFAKANNIGFRQATSRYVVFMNSDIELIDKSLLKMVNFLEKKKDIGIIGPKFLNPDLTTQASVFPPQTISNAFKEFWLGKQTYSKYIPKSKKATKVNAISGGCLAVSKDVYFYPNCQIIHRHGASGKNLASADNQWRRLIPSSKIFHGSIKHCFLNFIIWSGQKWQKLKNLAK